MDETSLAVLAQIEGHEGVTEEIIVTLL